MPRDKWPAMTGPEYEDWDDETDDEDPDQDPDEEHEPDKPGCVPGEINQIMRFAPEDWLFEQLGWADKPVDIKHHMENGDAV